ncbi:hypothetical protein [Streptomyces sp. 1331.2]|uniref:hypothetical protein n=1 Tax=Streptomyces sp. 1331.2 TaxID=1938835 RepID=UPI000BC48E9F|nr:hypothetical protein [Streptomyces sp. 1331.2]SOB86361.1 hypothetical protein SAMN06272789_6673 [Streptomyces sp. 1331.2]
MTYRPSSGAWSTIDLTGYAGTPATDGANLSAAFNPDGTLVLYSRNYADGHLQLTYHPTNGAWATTDLTGFVGTPPSSPPSTDHQDSDSRPRLDRVGAAPAYPDESRPIPSDPSSRTPGRRGTR